MMPKYHIGTLSPAAREALLNASSAPEISGPTEAFLNPRAWRMSTLISKRQVSWDSRIFTFALNSETQTLGLPVGQHLMIRLKNSHGKSIVRAYTPLSSDAKKGVVDILIKIYFDDEKTGAKGGKMTLALDALRKFTHTIFFLAVRLIGGGLQHLARKLSSRALSGSSLIWVAAKSR
jgi:nitrate reductase (NAD(P)H)